MSEDRHTFSEPRPIPGLDLPTWDVDVFRDGVPEPIFTLRIDSKALPPRKSKKKKVVWKLPDSVDQTPRFGIDEKRRLLDLFKNLKKERRKSQKRGSNVALDPTGIVEDLKSDDDYHEPETTTTRTTTTNSNNIPPPKDGDSRIAAAMGSMALGGQAEQPPPPQQQPPTNGRQQSNNPTPEPAPPRLSNGGLLSSAVTSPMLPPGMASPPSTTTRNGNSVPSENGGNLAAKPPPGMNRTRSEDGMSSQPPPGLAPVAPKSSQPPQSQTMSHHQSQEQNHVNNQQHLQQPLQTPSQPPQHPSTAPHQQQMQAPQPAPVSAPLPSLNPLLNIPLQLPPPARYMKCPPGMHPDIFAQQVANLYITLLQSGQVDELLMYYTMTAQKSLSLKSAKSICQTPSEMKTQLTSLVGCVFAVQGITIHTQGYNNSLLLIWSGICQLQGQQHGFCHTIVLVPFPSSSTATGVVGVGVEGNVLQYQIQNDALVLLTND